MIRCRRAAARHPASPRSAAARPRHLPEAGGCGAVRSGPRVPARKVEAHAAFPQARDRNRAAARAESASAARRPPCGIAARAPIADWHERRSKARVARSLAPGPWVDPAHYPRGEGPRPVETRRCRASMLRWVTGLDGCPPLPPTTAPYQRVVPRQSLKVWPGPAAALSMAVRAPCLPWAPWRRRNRWFPHVPAAHRAHRVGRARRHDGVDRARAWHRRPRSHFLVFVD